jgi:hypothetical protein
VRQKNTSGYTLRSADYGGEIGPGEEISHPDLITGCESLEPPPPDEKPAADPPPESKSVTRRKAVTDGGEATI